MTFKRLAIFTACLFLFAKMQGQNTYSDSASNSYTAVAKLYSGIISQNQQIYNGPEYVWSYPKTKGYPFYVSDLFQEGNIQYDGVSYFGILMQYELVKDVLVIKGANDARIELAMDRVSAFSIGNSYFKKINHQDLSGSFYQPLLNANGLEVIAERKKNLKRSGKAEDLDVFEEVNRYYIGRENKYYKISEPNDLYTLFANKEKLLKSFVKNKKLNFRKDPQTYIIELVAYYSSI